MTNPETRYLLQRAEEEAVRALQADNPEAAAAHQSLSVRYSAQAIIAIADDGEEAAMDHHLEILVRPAA